MKFRHLNVPNHWKHYWTKYPEGYTILEALLNWVTQVNDLTDNVNNWNEYLNKFVQTFDRNLQDKVTDILKEWQDSGFLDIVIDQALHTKYHEMDERLTSELAQRATYSDGLSASVNLTTSLFELYRNAIEQQNNNERDDVIRVATFNVLTMRQEYDFLTKIKRFLAESMAHFIGLQESISSHYFDFEKNLKSDVFPFSYFTQARDDAFGYFVGYRYGIGSISSKGFLEKSGKLYNMIDQAEEKRAYQRMVISFNGKRIALYNTHLSYNNRDEITNQLSQLYNAVVNDGENYKIVVGDFNTNKKNDFSLFTNSNYTLVNEGQYLTHDSAGAIDNIIVSPNIMINNAGMITSGALSDHHLLFADLKLL